MTDDLKDIDTELVEAILNNADAFITADASVDEIIMWGESELEALKIRMKESGGTVQDFRDESSRIESAVAEKLRGLETDIRKLYPNTEI